MAAEEPVTKKAKVDEETPAGEEKADAEMKPADEAKAAEPEAPKAPEPPKELEGDAPADKSARIKDKAWFNIADTTMNVMPTSQGGVLKSLTDNGCWNLVAGARANVGVKSGRYAFEVKVVELCSPAESDYSYNKVRRNLVKVGFAVAGSTLIAGEDAGSVAIDFSGHLTHGGVQQREPLWEGLHWSKHNVLRESLATVVLNLDEKHANFNTISLFKDGVRVCQPIPLPEALKGKTLYPCVVFKNATLHVNFNEPSLASMPFKCRMFGDASAKDATVTKEVVPKDGRYEVVVPIGLPDEGCMTWLELFHQKNPGYTEISTRMVNDWALKSGLSQQDSNRGVTHSNDKPYTQFNCQAVNDGTLLNMLKAMAPLQARNIVISEIRGNLLKNERQAIVEKFPSTLFKRVAQVLVGEPNMEFKKHTQEVNLKDKQRICDQKWKVEQERARNERIKEKRQKIHEKTQEILKKKAAKEQRRKEREFRKQQAAAVKAAEKLAEEAKAKRAAEEKEAADKEAAEAKALAGEQPDDKQEEKKEGAEGEEKKDDEKKEEEQKKEEEKKEEQKSEEKPMEVDEEEKESEDEPDEEPPKEEEEPPIGDPPKVELTPEEKKKFWVNCRTPDLAASVMSASFANFSVPEKEEGFDEIRYDFQKGPKAQEYIKNWVLERKLTTRVENLSPGEYFKNQSKAWQTEFRKWRSVQNEWKTLQGKKAAEKAAKAAAKKAAEEAKAAAEKAKAEAAEKAKEAAEKAKEAGEEAANANENGEEKKETEEKKEEEQKEEAKAEEPAPMEVEEEEKEEELPDFENVDIFGVDDVMDLGAKMPLFKEFTNDDWTMLTFRFELHLMGHAFKKDVNDPERIGIHMDHLAFYYQKYFNKPLNAADFGKEKLADVLALINDTVHVSKQNVLVPMLDEEMELLQVFVKLAEEDRRHRALRFDLGEADAKLQLRTNNQSWQKGGGKGDNNWQKGGGKGGKWEGNKGAKWDSNQSQAQNAATWQQQQQVMQQMKGGGKGAGNMASNMDEMWNKFNAMAAQLGFNGGAGGNGDGANMAGKGDGGNMGGAGNNYGGAKGAAGGNQSWGNKGAGGGNQSWGNQGGQQGGAQGATQGWGSQGGSAAGQGGNQGGNQSWGNQGGGNQGGNQSWGNQGGSAGSQGGSQSWGSQGGGNQGGNQSWGNQGGGQGGGQGGWGSQDKSSGGGNDWKSSGGGGSWGNDWKNQGGDGGWNKQSDDQGGWGKKW